MPASQPASQTCLQPPPFLLTHTTHTSTPHLPRLPSLHNAPTQSSRQFPSAEPNCSACLLAPGFSFDKKRFARPYLLAPSAARRDFFYGKEQTGPSPSLLSCCRKLFSAARFTGPHHDHGSSTSIEEGQSLHGRIPALSSRNAKKGFFRLPNVLCNVADAKYLVLLRALAVNDVPIAQRAASLRLASNFTVLESAEGERWQR